MTINVERETFKTLRLIFGDQLNSNHSWFSEVDPETVYVMMELRSETDYAWHHIQKICAFFAAMESFALEISQQGHSVIYLKLDDSENMQDFRLNCNQLIEKYRISEFQFQHPDEYRLDRMMETYGETLQIPTKAFNTEHFFTERNAVVDFFGNSSELTMEYFYRHLRKKHNVLMEESEPLGGQWNFDRENRKKLPKNHKPFPPMLFENDVRAQFSRVTKTDIIWIGTIDPKYFPWPINRSQSLQLLDHFVDYCLPLFGTFQDAMHEQEWAMYHSRLSFSLNTKMLSPAEVVSTAIDAFHNNTNQISVNQIEGFVRQILGWREFMRGIYWMKMPEFGSMNYFNHSRKLPKWYWSGETKMNCLKTCIKQSLENAYAHHIQRLMVTGNFALLVGINPDEVDFWYLGIYIDAIEWVEITNTRGMSQYADGGIVGSKPYVGSASYINKMSNYCDACHYDPTTKTAVNSCPFNSMYWDFYQRNREKLAAISRLKMIYQHWDDMSIATQQSIVARANDCLNNLDEL